MSKTPSETDRYIGARVRERRVELGMSQEKLGNSLGVTFQQVQKYEKGSNRMGAGRLQQAAHVLDIPVAYFYENSPIDLNGRKPTGTIGLATTGLSMEEAELLAAYRRLSNPTLRKRVQLLILAMAEE